MIPVRIHAGKLSAHFETLEEVFDQISNIFRHSRRPRNNRGDSGHLFFFLAAAGCAHSESQRLRRVRSHRDGDIPQFSNLQDDDSDGTAPGTQDERHVDRARTRSIEARISSTRAVAARFE